MNRHASLPSRQRGLAMLFAMVLMLLLTLAGFTAIGTSRINVQVAGNNQFRQQAKAAAQQGIEQVLSTDTFTRLPEQVAGTPIGVDLDGNGTDDLQVNITPPPACYAVTPIRTAELDPALPDDVPCYASGAARTSGYVGTSTGGNSLCSNTRWDVGAVVNDTTTSARVEMHQGVGVRIAATDAGNYCN